MIKIGIVDLQFLYLGMKNNSSFNETDIENSDLKRLGVGRILDTLASLKERKLLEYNKDGSFFVTPLAKQILWNHHPIWINILRLLEIQSCDLNTIAKFLKKPEEGLIFYIEELRKSQLILMSPLRKEGQLVKMYEILSEGVEKLKKVETEGIEKNSLTCKDVSNREINNLINKLINEMTDEPILKKEEIILKLKQIQNKLR